MNPIVFQNNGYATMLEKHKNEKCRVRLLGQYGSVYEGVFIGVRLCKEKELEVMAGFCLDIPVYKICVMVDNLPERGMEAIWINTLLIDEITDIQFQQE